VKRRDDREIEANGPLRGGRYIDDDEVNGISNGNGNGNA
jgi:hypothetical protein